MSDKKVVVLGGGNGAATVLASLKDKNLQLSAILGVADDGGSTGRLRRDYGISAVGDFRNCLAALASDKDSEVLNFRFGSGELKGHSFGNLILAAGELSYENLFESIDFVRRALGISAHIFPVSLDKPNLIAEVGDQKYEGVYNIAQQTFGEIPNLYLEPKPGIYDKAKDAILDADLIIIAPGNFYCSIMQILLVDGVIESIKSSKAKVAMISNLVNIDSQCRNFIPTTYADTAQKIVESDFIDDLIVNTEKIDEKYLREGESAVGSGDLQDSKYKIHSAKLLSKQPKSNDPNDAISSVRSLASHDKDQLAEVLEKVIYDQ